MPLLLKIFFVLIMSVHGLIHLMGFIKGFNYATLTQLTEKISRPMGLAWLATTILFTVTIALFLFKNEAWWIVGIVAITLSQTVIITSWKDAKFGTIPNIIIITILISSI